MKIVLFGDSITDMGRDRQFNTPNYVGSYGCGYPIFITGNLHSVNPHKHQIYNRGISGNRIVDLYARIKSDVWNLRPDLLSILIGVNDIWHELDFNNGVDVIRFEKVYRMLIEDTKEKLPKVKFILLEPFVLKGIATEEKYDEFCEVKKYAKVVEKLAKEYGCAFVALQDRFDEEAKKYGEVHYLYDGVHPDVAGGKLIAEEWLKVFYKEIQS